MSGLTYQHLVSVLKLELARRPQLACPTILDAGCGRGELLRLLGEAMPATLKGFDSPAYGLQHTESIGRLANPDDVEIRMTAADGSWPFDDQSFDVVVSNQVCEHVEDMRQFCAENARVLRHGGFAIHVFPLRHCLLEPHMRLPFVHWVRDHDLRALMIRQMSRMGLGPYRKRALHGQYDVDAFARAHADYSRTFTTYRTWRQVSDEFHRHGFRVSRRYTSMLLQSALLGLVGRSGKGHALGPVAESITFPITTAIASATILVEAVQEYRIDWREVSAGRGSPT